MPYESPNAPAPTERSQAWPASYPVAKTREIYNHHMNSEVWNNFKFRNDDVIIATYAKSGTTWMQQIVSQLIFKGAEGIDVSTLSPWIDMRVVPPEAIAALEQQAHRRFLKTHLPVDALVFSEKAKYIFVGRDGRDMVWSMHHHFLNAAPLLYDLLNNTPGRVGPEIDRPEPDVVQYFQEWLARDGYPLWPFWENVRSWWNIRTLPNVKLVHFNDLKRDLPGMIREIGDFLEIEHDSAVFQNIVEHCSFSYMKAHADKVAPLGGAPWEGGAATFINKGINGRWKDILPETLSRAYEFRARQELGEDGARWLQDGGAI
jgi:aryl sulfotransferase